MAMQDGELVGAFAPMIAMIAARTGLAPKLADGRDLASSGG